MVAQVYIWRVNKRDCDIRLVLGTHPWGSSDPALWDVSLLTDVIRPCDQFRVPSFADLARGWMGTGALGWAMWAARLCVAMENEQVGEELTSQILAHPALQQGLEAVRKDPAIRDQVFGPVPPFSNWVRGNYKSRVFQIP